MLTFVICMKQERPCECQEPDIPQHNICVVMIDAIYVSLSLVAERYCPQNIYVFTSVSASCIAVRLSNCLPTGPDVMVSFEIQHILESWGLLRSQDGAFEVDLSFIMDYSLRPLLYLGWCYQCSAVMIQVYFRGLIHRRRWQGDLLGDNPDHCTERVFVWVGPTHVLLGPFLSPVTSQSLLWPVGAGRLNVTTPFSSPVCPLRTHQPINFHSAFTQIPWFPPPALISNTCPRDTKTHTQRASLLKLEPH